MNAYECDRCGTMFKRKCLPETIIAIDQHPNGYQHLDLCPKCQKELENWLAGVQFDSSLNPTLREGV